MRSFSASFKSIKQLLDGFQIPRRRLPCGQRLHDQRFYGTIKGALDQIAQELPLGLLLRVLRAVDLRTAALVALDKTLLGHDLNRLQDSGISRRLRFIKRVLNVSDGSRA